MEREIDLKEISDGKLYSANDMVKAGCDDCKGCSDCCRGVFDYSGRFFPLQIQHREITESRGNGFQSDSIFDLSAFRGGKAVDGTF